MADRRQLREKTVQLPKFERVALLRAETFNADDNTIEIVWTTGATVRRYDYWDGTEYDEVLSLEDGAVRLERLNAGAPLLNSHNSYGLENVLGSVVPDTARLEDGKGICRVLLSRADGDKDIVQKIKDGVIRNISVGYWIHKVVKTEVEDGTVARWDIIDWEPLEVSAVPIPADPGSQIRSEQSNKDGKGPALRSCVLVIPSPPASAPKKARTQEKSMANRTTAGKGASKRTAKTAAEIEAEKKRRAELRAAAQRAEDDKDDKDDDSDEERDEDEDESRGADDADKKDEDSDDERDGDDAEDDEADDADDEDDKDGKDDKRALSAAEIRKAAEAAVRADRVRGAQIREIAAQFGFPKLGERHANGETSVRKFKDLVLERLAERQKKRGNTTFSGSGSVDLEDASRSAAPATARDYDKGAAEARTLLGKK